jgi:signal transduction histidine kinase
MRLQVRYSLTLLSLIVGIAALLAAALGIHFQATMVAASRTGTQVMARELRAQMEQRGAVMARFLAGSLVNPVYQLDMEAIRELLQVAKEQPDVVAVRVLDPQGRILHDGSETIPRFGQPFGDGTPIRPPPHDTLLITKQGDLLRVTAPIRIAGDTPLGSLHLTLSLAPVRKEATHMRRELDELTAARLRQQALVVTAVTVALAALGAVLAFLVAERLAHPLRVLRDHARRVGSGEYPAELPIQRRDEVGDLARELEAMSRSLRQTTIRRDELEERVQHRTAELQAVNEELQSFAHSVSHDLRAPLRSIAGFTQALFEECLDRDDATTQDYAQRIQAATRRMGELIDGLLVLSRVTRAEINRGRVDLSRQAREVLDELRRRDPERRVQTRIAPDLVAYADRRMLRSLLDNLIGNAWKFTARRDPGIIEVGAVERDAERAFYVRDNGAGFDMRYADKLFGTFQRLHAAGEFDGTGVGLATVQRILQRHGGRAWAEGTVDRGATFYFTLPE